MGTYFTYIFIIGIVLVVAGKIVKICESKTEGSGSNSLFLMTSGLAMMVLAALALLIGLLLYGKSIF